MAKFEPYENHGIAYFPYISVNPNYSTIYYISDNPKKHHDNVNSNFNLLSNKTFGFLSEISKKKIKKAINLLLYLSPKKTTGIVDKKINFKYQITFCTLTLPSKQKHTDKEIVQTCLHDFLNILRNCYNLEHYVWKAEKQTNGNIHFHITFNLYIHWMDLREIWIKCINKLGYVENYSNNMKEFHKNGFKCRYDLLKKWNLFEQKSAYDYGIKTNWKSPNCTDIHSVINVKELAAYVSEYFTKNPLDEENTEKFMNACKNIKNAERTIKLLKKQINDENGYTNDYIVSLQDIIDKNTEVIEMNKLIVKEYEKNFVDCRIWFLSRSLSGFSGKIPLDYMKNIEEIDNYTTQNPTKLENKEYVSLLKANIVELEKGGCKEIKKQYDTLLNSHIEKKQASKKKLLI